MTEPPDRVRLQRWTFLVLFAFSGWLFWRTAAPLFVPLFLGILVAIGVRPLYVRLVARSPRREAAVAAGLTAAVLLIGIGVLAFLLTVVSAELVSFARSALEHYKHGGTRELLGPRLSALLQSAGGEPESVLKRVAQSAEAAAGRLAELTGTIVVTSLNGLVVLIFTALTSYYLLREGGRILDWLVGALPLPPEQVLELAKDFRDVTQAMLLGTGATAVYQGVIAFVGYLIFQVPSPLLWAALTGVASLLPGVGTTLVWAPIAIWLVATGHIGLALGVVAWGVVLIVGVADYLLRPRLLGKKVRMNELLVFIAIFGGIEAFGLLGLILGPIFVALFVSFVRIYEREYKPDRVTTAR
jgi:predicted PurR-regulated permease PerM